MNEQNRETFTYTYSASQQEEIQEIRKKYMPAEQVELDKMEQLRRLDASATRKGSTTALILGVISALIMGSGMSLTMTDLGTKLGLGNSFLPGIVIGIIGMVGVIAAYPLYQRITTKERARIAPQILKLTEELSK